VQCKTNTASNSDHLCMTHYKKKHGLWTPKVPNIAVFGGKDALRAIATFTETYDIGELARVCRETYAVIRPHIIKQKLAAAHKSYNKEMRKKSDILTSRTPHITWWLNRFEMHFIRVPEDIYVLPINGVVPSRIETLKWLLRIIKHLLKTNDDYDDTYIPNTIVNLECVAHINRMLSGHINYQLVTSGIVDKIVYSDARNTYDIIASGRVIVRFGLCWRGRFNNEGDYIQLNRPPSIMWTNQ
jgi:hypothetical protein